jgi:hypothetical protein
MEGRAINQRLRITMARLHRGLLREPLLFKAAEALPKARRVSPTGVGE